MIHKCKEETDFIYVRSMGKALRILAIADNDDEANRYMERNDRAAVIACFGPLVFMASKYDKGTNIPRD